MYTVETLTKGAETLGVDGGKFKECLNNKTDNDRVKQDLADGRIAGVQGTPTFFVNGKQLQGVPDYNAFKSAIESLLK
jgi:protein-disulfide isomerase